LVQVTEKARARQRETERKRDRERATGRGRRRKKARSCVKRTRVKAVPCTANTQIACVLAGVSGHSFLQHDIHGASVEPAVSYAASGEVAGDREEEEMKKR
jgi:hypothetical protein